MTLPTDTIIEASTTMSGAGPTLADLLKQYAELDVDTMNPAYAQQIVGKPCDMTSNQFVMAAMLCDEANTNVVADSVARLGKLGWQAVFCDLAAFFCKRVVGHIRGRVWVQVSPSIAYDGEAVKGWARAYADAFAAHGIATDRFGIKIPTTGPGMIAAKELLEQDGIACLGTAMFSVTQAVAASQARCYAISPYYNEIKVHSDPTLCPAVEDPITQHPMSPRIAQISHVYRQRSAATGGERQPQLKTASFKRWQEVMACAVLGSDNVTVLEGGLDQLLHTPVAAASPFRSSITPDVEAQLLDTDPLLAAGQPPFDRSKLPSFETDWLANNGAPLDAANAADPATAQRLADALEVFVAFELQCRTFLEDRIAGKPTTVQAA